jgi:hypothetical protein
VPEVPPLTISNLHRAEVSSTSPPDVASSSQQNNSALRSMRSEKSVEETNDDVDDGGYKEDEEDGNEDDDSGSISSSSPLKRSHLAANSIQNQLDDAVTQQQRRLMLDLTKVSHHDHRYEESGKSSPRKKQKTASTLHPSSLSSLSYFPQNFLINGKNSQNGFFDTGNDSLHIKSESPGGTVSISSDGESSSLMKDPTFSSVTSLNEYKWSTLYQRNALKSKEIRLQKLIKLIDIYSIPVFSAIASSSSSSSVENMEGNEEMLNRIMEAPPPSSTSESYPISVQSSSSSDVPFSSEAERRPGKETDLIASLMKGLHPTQAQAKLLKWLDELEHLEL